MQPFTSQQKVFIGVCVALLIIGTGFYIRSPKKDSSPLASFTLDICEVFKTTGNNEVFIYQFETPNVQDGYNELSKLVSEDVMLVQGGTAYSEKYAQLMFGVKDSTAFAEKIDLTMKQVGYARVEKSEEPKIVETDVTPYETCADRIASLESMTTQISEAKSEEERANLEEEKTFQLSLLQDSIKTWDVPIVVVTLLHEEY